MKSKTTVTVEDKMPMQDDEHSQGARVAVLRNDVRHLNETLNRVEAKLDTMALNYVTNTQLTAAQIAADATHKDINEHITALQAEVTMLNSWKDTVVTRIAVYSIIVLVAMVLANYGLEKYF